MTHRLSVSAIVVGICLLAAGLYAPAAPAQKPAQNKKSAKELVFEACKHGCKYRTIQKAVDAAGAAKFKNPKAKTVVLVRPGKYVEGVVLDGTARKMDFDDLTIEGTKKNRKKVVLEGKNAKGELGAAQNGIEAVSVDGLVMRNMWARNYQSNGFFVHADTSAGQHCVDYTMDNLLASNNRSYGLFAKGCYAGKMINSSGYHQGDAAFYVGETPCDNRNWSVHTSVPCQSKPQWTLLKNDSGYENVLGYSGTNSKYVKIVESSFYNNGAGIVPNTLDSEGYEPNGWNVIERNDIFWNNYNYFLAGSAFHTVSGGLGELAGATINYPTGAGILLYGGDSNVIRRNKVFGNYKWGIASFSGPGESFEANQGDDAKNVNNEITENTMSREGADPNGEYDFWNDATGGGNCWGANNAIATYAPGNGSLPLSQIYPTCPVAPVAYDSVRSLNTTAGLQVLLTDVGNPHTLLGYAGTSPPQNQQCSWVRRLASHPKFQNYKPVEVAARPGELAC